MDNNPKPSTVEQHPYPPREETGGMYHGEVKPAVTGKKKISRKISEILIYLYAAIVVLLLARFIFSMVAARQVAPFVDFVYQLSIPLMIPFANMFGPLQSGPYRLELEVFVALIIYGVIFFGISKLVNIIFE